MKLTEQEKIDEIEHCWVTMGKMQAKISAAWECVNNPKMLSPRVRISTLRKALENA
jgi:hypothetical protein